MFPLQIPKYLIPRDDEFWELFIVNLKSFVCQKILFLQLDNGHRNILFFNKTNPENTFGAGVWIAPSACVIGDVYINDNSSVWYGAVIRGTYKK